MPEKQERRKLETENSGAGRLRKVLPSKRVCEKFNLAYELKGAQRAVDLLARHYGIRRMTIVVDGRRVANSDRACYDYDSYTAYFKKRTIRKRLVLHEFYHHLAYVEDWDMSGKKEEREADRYARSILRTGRS